jgi:selenocysteine lyase/cysteine desulfurase
MPLLEPLPEWRADTPGCEHVIHLNNAGAALMPASVVRAIRGHIELEAVAGGYEAEDHKASAIAETYELLARLIHCAARNIAVTANATAGFVQALSAFDFAPGDAIVTSRCDYTSNQIQYLSLAKRRGIEIRHAADLPEGGVDAGSIRALIRQGKCKLVAVSWVPTNSGLVQDVQSVSDVCEAEGVPLLIDACQAVGQMPVDVSKVKCDYLTATARKFLRGPRGLGFMYVSDRALARGDYPLYVDMRGAEWVTSSRFAVVDSAKRFEDWEFPQALVLGLAEAVRYALHVGIDVAQQRSHALAAYVRERLRASRLRVLDRGKDPCAIVTVAIPNAEGIVAALRERAINVTRTLRWYGIYDMDEKGVPDALRISPHYYNTQTEIDSFMDALRDVTT